MKNNKGITLIIVIMTVVLLAILAGLIVVNSLDTHEGFEVIRFKTQMLAIQKKVDLIVEENNNYLNLGRELTTEEKATLQTIIDGDSRIATRDANEPNLRYFSSSDIEMVFDLSDINDDIVVNFSNRDVISLKGIKNGNTMHYVDYTM